jgi:hypothetical protein
MNTTEAKNVPVEDDDDAWEDEPDSKRERQLARRMRRVLKSGRATGREIRRTGAQSAMSEILGREVCDFEMEMSHRLMWDF